MVKLNVLLLALWLGHVYKAEGASGGAGMIPGRDAFNEKYGNLLSSIPSYRDTVHRERNLQSSRITVEECNALPEFDSWRTEIQDPSRGYQNIANRIIQAATEGDFKGVAYNSLADFVYKFGFRMSGTENLERSIDHILDRMQNVYNFSNVQAEEVVVPRFHRGQELATLHGPNITKNLPVLALLPTVSTPPGGIREKVLVVRSFEELEEKADQAKGKIIVYNQEWDWENGPAGGYSKTNRYRTQGASAASRLGAIASLTRSIAPFSIDSPHTGGQTYQPDVDHIPTGCITHEDAELMQRYQDEGMDIEISLQLECFKMPSTTSRNAIGEITGRVYPSERVAVTGHIDSWDVGIGAMDDAGGFMIGVEALALIKHLGLPAPKRSLQAIMWTSEETGLIGVEEYAKRHKDDLLNMSAVFESDSGTFDPLGLEFAGSDLAACIVREVLQLLAPIQANEFSGPFPSVSSDITVLIGENVPGIGYHNKNDKYFWFHHTHADTMLVQNTTEMDRGLALWATTAYVIADLDRPLPRREARSSLLLDESHVC